MTTASKMKVFTGTETRKTAGGRERYDTLRQIMPGEYADFSRGITVGMVEISPQAANAILEKFQPRNPDGTVHNRPLTESHIASLETAIRNDEVDVRWESVIFDEKTEMIDGQHTMHAVKRAGKSIRTMVLIGPPAAAFKVINQGLPRNSATLFQIQGENEPTSLAASVKTFYTFLATGKVQTPGADNLLRGNQAVDKFLKKCPDIRASVDFISGMPYARRITKMKGRLPVMHYLFSMHDAALASEFFRALDVPEADIHALSPRVQPALELRGRLLKAFTDNRMRLNQREVAAIMIKSWNQCVTGDRKRTTWSSREPFPQIHGITYDRDTGRPILPGVSANEPSAA